MKYLNILFEQEATELSPSLLRSMSPWYMPIGWSVHEKGMFEALNMHIQTFRVFSVEQPVISKWCTVLNLWGYNAFLLELYSSEKFNFIVQNLFAVWTFG